LTEQWSVHEVVLRSELRWDNPFTDVRLRGEFSTGVTTTTVDGFYDGDQTWKLRFMPDEQGDWAFTTSSNDAKLDGVTGSFAVEPPSAGNHGPVNVAATHHFSYADGTPYFLLGTTLYNWLNRDRELEERTLATLARSPFTKVRFGLFPKWMIYNRVDPQSYPYVETADGVFDLGRFDPGFFAHVEERILDLQGLGIEADVILFHPYDRWGFAGMDAAHDDAYIRYVAARLSAFRNVWWTMCNEYNLFHSQGWPGMDLEPKDWDELFEALEACDPYGRLKGMHNAGPWYDHAKPWITHVIAQESRHIDALTRRGRMFGKPVVVDECGYEGNAGHEWGDLSAQEVIDRHWEVTFAGGYASHGETYVHPGGILWWAVGGELVGDSPARLGFLRELMSASAFHELRPAPELVLGGSALAEAGRRYLFRFTSLSMEPAQIRTDGQGPFEVDLIDPWQMTVHSLGCTPAGAQALVPPFVPSILRLTSAPHTTSTGTLTELLARFVGDPTEPVIAEVRPFAVAAEHFSTDWPMHVLLHDSRARRVIERHIPAVVETVTEISVLGAFPLSALVPENRGMVAQLIPGEALVVTREELDAIALELAEIPVP
jgi:Domain of unknown function (DUF5060)/Protein of unknown function (DUF4038)